MIGLLCFIEAFNLAMEEDSRQQQAAYEDAMYRDWLAQQ